MKAWLIDIDYITKNEKAVVRMWCKDSDGVFVAYDRTFEPYFYVISDYEPYVKVEDGKKTIAVERIERVKRKILGKEKDVFKVFAKHPQHVPKLRESISKFADVREADIPFVYRYLIDKDLACFDGIALSGKLVGKNFREFEVESVERVRENGYPDLKIMAFDCEMLSSFGMPDPERDPIIVIGVKSGDYEEIINGDNEREVIKRFVQVVKEIDPDIIVGYNQNSFDLPYLKKRATKLGIKLDLGRDGSELTLRGNPKIAGRLNVDLYDIVLRTIDVKVKKLENVAEFLGKRIEIADITAKDIAKRWKEGKRKDVLNYSLQDVLHTYYIAEELLPMYYELSKMIRIPLDDVTRMGRGKQVDWLLLNEAYKLGEIAPNPAEISQPYEGAFVLEPERGLHENVVCLDFASMYPSIMIAFNISPDTLAKGPCDCHTAPEVGHRFLKSPDGFFKRILKMLIGKRKEIKKIMKTLDYNSPDYRVLDIRQQALKVLTNSFYGYTGWNMARWYCRECAEATTAWGRHFIKKSAEIARNMGFTVLYGDTDSIFVKKDGLSIDEMRAEVKRLIMKLSEELPIQIEVDEYYKTIFFVEKKRYAGYTEDGRIIVKGLEVRRGDWCELAKKVQKMVIEILLKERDPEKALKTVKSVIEKINSGSFGIEEYVIYKSITRKISRYESVQAHVKAAMRAEKMGIHYSVGSKVGYVIVRGAGNIGDRAYPYDLIESFDGEIIRGSDGGVYRIDKEYYIENQILPSVMRILERFGYTDGVVKGEAEQKTLDSFF